MDAEGATHRLRQVPDFQGCQERNERRGRGQRPRNAQGRVGHPRPVASAADGGVPWQSGFCPAEGGMRVPLRPVPQGVAERAERATLG